MFGEADDAHAMVNPAGAEATLGNLEATPFAEQDIGHRYSYILEFSSMRASTLVASLEATAGSVIANAERISPARRGLSHCSCCDGVP